MLYLQLWRISRGKLSTSSTASFYLNNLLFIYKFHSILMIYFSLFSSSFQNDFLPVSVVFRLHGGCTFSSVNDGSQPAKSTFPNRDFASGELCQKKNKLVRDEDIKPRVLSCFQCFFFCRGLGACYPRKFSKLEAQKCYLRPFLSYLLRGLVVNILYSHASNIANFAAIQFMIHDSASPHPQYSKCVK